MHDLSVEDIRFRTAFEDGSLPPAQFDHRAHVRLAYTYLAGNSTETAAVLLRASLLAYLRHHGIDTAKYHETMTRAWILAVRHFMALSPDTASADEFIDANPTLLDGRIMLTHYSAELLFSAAARASFAEPDLQDIPRHDAALNVDAEPS
jgi:hypothetical protein